MRPPALAVRAHSHAISRLSVPAFPPKPEATVTLERLPAAAVRDGFPVLQLITSLRPCRRARIVAAWSFPVPAVYPPIHDIAFTLSSSQYCLLFSHLTINTRRSQ
jgi:hypothetical protein